MKRSNFLITALQCLAIVTLFGFDSPQEDVLNLKKVDGETYTTNNLTVNQVKQGVEITIPKGSKGVISFSASDEYWDLTSYKYMSIELENKSDQQVRFDPVLIYDNPRKKYLKKKENLRNEHIGFINSGENLVFNCTMIRDAVTKNDYPQSSDFKGMKGIPEGVVLNFAGVDASRIKKVNIEFPSQEFERRVILKRVFKNQNAVSEIYTKNKEEFFPFINEYGQYIHENWEGKITNDAQLKEALVKEEKELLKYSGSKEWDRFGGYKLGPQFNKTGHFRTQKIDGKWWIIDPEGHLFWSNGINGAGKLEVKTPIKGREHYFKNLPAKNAPEYAKFYDGQKYMFGKQNLYKKYGENSEFKYIDFSLRRMRSWGLNTLGGWSEESINEHKEENKLPYTVIVHETYPEIHEKFPDVFNPKWESNLEEKLKKRLEGKADDPFLFGVFVNNEIHWKNPAGLAISTLEKGKKSYGKAAFVKLLQDNLKEIHQFNKLAGTSFSSWEELLNTSVKKKEIKWTNIRKYTEAHYKKMCETYFGVSQRLIKKYAPNTMYIGCRWHGNHKNNINLEVSAKYLDLMSFNAYENEVEHYKYPYKYIDKPFIISEFNFGALDTGKFFPGLGYASNQRNRGEKYINFVSGALRNPRCVGTHWFMWANSTTAGKGNGENANCGVVSATDQVYYELVNYMRQINYKMYSYRLQQQ
ncbi:hypothetical protein [Flammeovirga sp. SubArs3]|uniref:hypothetical protein n=1 Tax=Flammeovirga sp. SubArs3 TaxID=2995316 RepID=UPI00248CE981|nr:hypothetical protein [Flammeovirga sp. SubArs3]